MAATITTQFKDTMSEVKILRSIKEALTDLNRLEEVNLSESSTINHMIDHNWACDFMSQRHPLNSWMTSKGEEVNHKKHLEQVIREMKTDNSNSIESEALFMQSLATDLGDPPKPDTEEQIQEKKTQQREERKEKKAVLDVRKKNRNEAADVKPLGEVSNARERKKTQLYTSVMTQQQTNKRHKSQPTYTAVKVAEDEEIDESGKDVSMEEDVSDNDTKTLPSAKGTSNKNKAKLKTPTVVEDEIDKIDVEESDDGEVGQSRSDRLVGWMANPTKDNLYLLEGLGEIDKALAMGWFKSEAKKGSELYKHRNDMPHLKVVEGSSPTYAIFSKSFDDLQATQEGRDELKKFYYYFQMNQAEILEGPEATLANSGEETAQVGGKNEKDSSLNHDGVTQVTHPAETPDKSGEGHAQVGGKGGKESNEEPSFEDEGFEYRDKFEQKVRQSNKKDPEARFNSFHFPDEGVSSAEHLSKIFDECSKDRQKTGAALAGLSCLVETTLNSILGEDAITLSHSRVLLESDCEGDSAKYQMSKLFPTIVSGQTRAGAFLTGNHGHYGSAVVRSNQNLPVGDIRFFDGYQELNNEAVKIQNERLLRLVTNSGVIALPTSLSNNLKLLGEGTLHSMVEDQKRGEQSCAEHALLNGGSAMLTHMGRPIAINNSSTREALLGIYRGTLRAPPGKDERTTFSEACKLLKENFLSLEDESTASKLSRAVDVLLGELGANGHGDLFVQKEIDFVQNSRAKKKKPSMWFMKDDGKFKTILEACGEFRQAAADHGRSFPPHGEFQLNTICDPVEFFSMVVDANSALQQLFRFQEGSSKNLQEERLQSLMYCMYVTPVNGSMLPLTKLLEDLNFGKVNKDAENGSHRSCIGEPPECLVVAVCVDGSRKKQMIMDEQKFSGSHVIDSWNKTEFTITSRILFKNAHYITLVSTDFDKDGNSTHYTVADDLCVTKFCLTKNCFNAAKWKGYKLIVVFALQTKFFKREEGKSGFKIEVTSLPRKGAEGQSTATHVSHTGEAQGKVSNTCYQNVMLQSISAVKLIRDGYDADSSSPS